MRHFSFPQKSEGRKTAKKNKKKQQTWIQKTNKEQQERTSILGSGAYVVFQMVNNNISLLIRIDVLNNNNTANSIRSNFGGV